jgi:cytochrome c553
MSRSKQVFRTFAAAAFTILFLGCGGSSTNAPRFNTATGQHPTDWLQNHWAQFIANPAQCTTCHGSTTDKASTGGISGVSCFKCHANGPSHQAGWEVGLKHGRMGAQAAPSNTTGFAYCAKCHGSTYDNPVGTSPSCKSCHTKAPHPAKPWLGGSEALSNHVFTNVGNATECYKCHKDGANSTLKPTTPALAGTAPGCFNNTMCHGTSIH